MTRPDNTDKFLERRKAVDEAMEALGIEPEFTNYYRCDECEVDWIDSWDCACDDECPQCECPISPYKWEVDTDDVA